MDNTAIFIYIYPVQESRKRLSRLLDGLGGMKDVREREKMSFHWTWNSDADLLDLFPLDLE